MPKLTAQQKRAIPALFLLGVLGLVPALAWSTYRRQEKSGRPLQGADGTFKYTNRLIHETSPYLLQHAHNPVDWYPWGPEAWEKAKRENKPIFLSIGYSACHWCHVMEREDFENEEVAKILNAGFVAVKVDREQRPDIDAQYMLALQMMTGSGGWPMSLFLTPDRKPFFGGTYFPAEEFKPLLQKVVEVYRSQTDRVQAQANQVAAAVAAASAPTSAGKVPADSLVQATRGLQSEYDPVQGGFAPKPKFPEAPQLAFLLARYHHSGDRSLLQMVTNTLDHMADGGIYDQIGGGFHRYSTDAIWRVPHFEKMLYDQALLVPIYLDAYQITHAPRYRQVAEETLSFVSREMRNPDGGFISTIDADSEGEEGKYYLWTPEQVRAVLGTDAVLFAELYGVTPGGDLNGGSVLHIAAPITRVAKAHGIAPEELAQRVEQMRRKLLAAREMRVHPRLDDKALANWNGLMIAAYARAAQILGDARDRQIAVEAAGFLESKMTHDGALLHSYREGRADVPAMLEDDAFTAYGLLALYDATHDARWLGGARALATDMVARFGDARGGFYATTAQGELLTRLKSGQDDATPSGNGVAAQVLARLAATGDQSSKQQAVRTVEAFEPLIARAAHACPTLLVAYQELGSAPILAAPSCVTLQLASVTAQSGSLYRISLRLHVASGWHINAHIPSAAYLIPTILHLSVPTQARLVSTTYPLARQAHFAFSPQSLAVYEGDVTLQATIKLTNVAAGRSRVRFVVSYQPCNDRACLTPTSTQVDIGL